MNEPRVWDVHLHRGHEAGAGAVYIGRGGKWGNPFVIRRDGARAEVIAKHQGWLMRQPALMVALPELRGRHLVCFCAPEPCHGDTLLELEQTADHLGRP